LNERTTSVFFFRNQAVEKLTKREKTKTKRESFSFSILSLSFSFSLSRARVRSLLSLRASLVQLHCLSLPRTRERRAHYKRNRRSNSKQKNEKMRGDAILERPVTRASAAAAGAANAFAGASCAPSTSGAPDSTGYGGGKRRSGSGGEVRKNGEHRREFFACRFSKNGGDRERRERERATKGPRFVFPDRSSFGLASLAAGLFSLLTRAAREQRSILSCSLLPFLGGDGEERGARRGKRLRFSRGAHARFVSRQR